MIVDIAIFQWNYNIRVRATGEDYEGHESFSKE